MFGTESRKVGVLPGRVLDSGGCGPVRELALDSILEYIEAL